MPLTSPKYYLKEYLECLLLFYLFQIIEMYGEIYTKASSTKRTQGLGIQWMNRFKSKKELNKRK